MTAFDFLNTKKIIDTVFKDKRKGNNKTAYDRFRRLARGEYDSNKPPIEEHELTAFFDEYVRQDGIFREAITQLKKKLKS